MEEDCDLCQKMNRSFPAELIFFFLYYIPRCGHTFCSLCVRRYLTVHRRACPECLNDLSEADLRPNRAVAAVAEAVAGENGFLRRYCSF